jgi:hypothetical protein
VPSDQVTTLVLTARFAFASDVERDHASRPIKEHCRTPDRVGNHQHGPPITSVRPGRCTVADTLASAGFPRLPSIRT